MLDTQLSADSSFVPLLELFADTLIDGRTSLIVDPPSGRIPPSVDVPRIESRHAAHSALHATGCAHPRHAYTVDDAATFTSPWSVQFPLTYTDSQGYESTCHEHNYSMRLMLSGARAEEEAAKFVGAFKLVSYECYGPGGGVTTAPYREGSMLYDDSGQMSAHLVNPDRPTPEGTPSEADRAKLYQSYFAYFGRYDVNVYQGVVRHYVEGGLRPGLDDRTLVRAYEFDDDDTRLVLTEKDGDRVVGRVTWERRQ